jgi:GT2 family glycosyltransferase
LSEANLKPDRHVVVAMHDPEIASVIAHEPLSTVVLTSDEGDLDDLALSAARNAGAEHAIGEGAELLIFLDVDCIPGPGLVRAYADAASHAAHRDAILCGAVTYLEPPGPAGYPSRGLEAFGTPHPARPNPPAGSVIVGSDYNLFWSLSFAVTAAVWTRVGGFCVDYRGYGGEDTDFAWTARARGIGLRWVGGADAFHQHHRVSNPPVEHLDAIIRNAAIFHRRWEVWPMTGWLTAFEAIGLIHFNEAAGRWERSPERAT